jgi:hypothetical protein
MKTKSLKTKKVIAYLQANPSAKPSEVAKKFKISPSYVYILRSEISLAKKNSIADEQYKLHFSTSDKPLTKSSTKVEAVNTLMPLERADRIRLLRDTDRLRLTTLKELNSPNSDNVNHPPHYKIGGIETIDFIEAKSLGYNLGNVIKYVTRADHKGSRDEDLQKALWYLNREISKLNK